MTPFSRCSVFDMDIVKLCGVGLICAFCSLILRQIKGEYAPLVRVCGTVVILGSLTVWSADIMAEVMSYVVTDEISEYMRIMLKALGLCLISKLCADICRDMGESAIGNGIELSCRLAILSLCLPLIDRLMGYARELIGS